MGGAAAAAAVAAAFAAVVAAGGLAGDAATGGGGGGPGPIEVSPGGPDAHEITPGIKERLDDIKRAADGGGDPGSGYDPDRAREWPTSGPFQIDRRVYALGENVFVRTGIVDYEEKGQIAFLRPLNSTHDEVYITIPFDGLGKPAFNQYFKPALSEARGICTAGELVGEWTAVFRGTDYPDLRFRVTDEMIVPGTEGEYEPAC